MRDTSAMPRLVSAAGAIVRLAEERAKKDADRQPDYQERNWTRLSRRRSRSRRATTRSSTGRCRRRRCGACATAALGASADDPAGDGEADRRGHREEGGRQVRRHEARGQGRASCPADQGDDGGAEAQPRSRREAGRGAPADAQGRGQAGRRIRRQDAPAQAAIHRGPARARRTRDCPGREQHAAPDVWHGPGLQPGAGCAGLPSVHGPGRRGGEGHRQGAVRRAQVAARRGGRPQARALRGRAPARRAGRLPLGSAHHRRQLRLGDPEREGRARRARLRRELRGHGVGLGVHAQPHEDHPRRHPVRDVGDGRGRRRPRSAHGSWGERRRSIEAVRPIRGWWRWPRSAFRWLRRWERASSTSRPSASRRRRCPPS